MNFKREHSTAKDFAVSAFSHVSLGFGDTSGVCTDVDVLELAQVIQEAQKRMVPQRFGQEKIWEKMFDNLNFLGWASRKVTEFVPKNKTTTQNLDILGNI